MIEIKPKVKHATVDSCFELVGSRQHGLVARSTMFNEHEVSCDDSGWAPTKQLYLQQILLRKNLTTKNMTFKQYLSTFLVQRNSKEITLI